MSTNIIYFHGMKSVGCRPGYDGSDDFSLFHDKIKVVAQLCETVVSCCLQIKLKFRELLELVRLSWVFFPPQNFKDTLIDLSS